MIIMSDIDTLGNMDKINDVEETCAQAERNDDNLTPSQKRMKDLMERHIALLAFNEKLEAALRDKNTKAIDECLEHSRNNDYMAQHRQYMDELNKDLTMAELTKEMTNQVMN